MGKLRIPSPRLLPATIAAATLLLAAKSVDLVRGLATGEPAAGLASPVVPSAQAAVPETPPVAPPAAPAPTPAPAAAAPVSAAERGLLQDLRARRAELDGREAALTAREAVLDAAEKKLSARVEELGALQARLQQLDAERKQRDEANWQGLVKLYEAMKPRDAATIFNGLDMPVLLQVLDRMKERKAAPVLAAMQPDRARDATAQLAQMRTRANDPAR